MGIWRLRTARKAVTLGTQVLYSVLVSLVLSLNYYY